MERLKDLKKKGSMPTDVSHPFVFAELTARRNQPLCTIPDTAVRNACSLFCQMTMTESATAIVYILVALRNSFVK